MSRHFIGAIGAVIAAFTMVCLWQQREAASVVKTETLVTPKRLAVSSGSKTATFAGGCFWGVEETFRTIPGVLDTHAGYTGGTTQNPTYETMHHDKSGHVEAVEVQYDPHQVSYHKLLEAFFAYHDPTRPGKNDVAMGKQYRSFVFFHDAEQERAAQDMVRALTKSQHYKGAPRPIATQIKPAATFWTAEEYHQRYYEKRAMTNTCRL